MSNFTRVGLEALLTPDHCVVVLIDHQPFQLANVNCHEPTMVINIVTDASGGVSNEAHDMAVRRLVAAGAQPITWIGMAGELQRDWARTEKLGEVGQILFEHAGASGSVLGWEMQLLNANQVKGV
jgi:hypothetical protein